MLQITEKMRSVFGVYTGEEPVEPIVAAYYWKIVPGTDGKIARLTKLDSWDGPEPPFEQISLEHKPAGPDLDTSLEASNYRRKYGYIRHD
jgi:hypothetical protein